MYVRAMFYIILINLVIGLVNGYLEFQTPNEALNQSLYEKAIDEELCAEQINIIRQNPALAIEFADAGIRIPKGILQGNTLDMGNYHQCIGLSQTLPNGELQGKYCVIRVPVIHDIQLLEFPILDSLSENSQHNFDPRLLRLDNEIISDLKEYYTMKLNFPAYTGLMPDDRLTPESGVSDLEFTLSVCIPKPCTTRQAIDSFLFNISAVRFDYSDVYCRLPNDKPRAPVDYVAIAVFSLLGIMTFVSTSYDLWHTFVKKTDNELVSVVGKSFSVYTNGRRVMNFKSGPDTIECLDGIRALAMAWVVLGHSFSSESSWSNPLETIRWVMSWQSLWVVSAHYTVDTFFTLSGFLVVYTTVGKLNGKSLLRNLHLFYLNRILRIFPLLATVVLLEASLLNHMTDGPNWTTVANQVNRCRAAWWSTLLHIQNYMNPRTTCVGQSWYLAIDTQLHILSPILLVWVLWGNRKLAWTALVVGFLSVLTASTIYIFINQFPPLMMRPSTRRNYLVYYYVNTLTRASPFLVGVIFGYLVRSSKVKLKGIWMISFWIAFFTVGSYLVYFNYPIQQTTWDNQFMSSFYNSFFRTFWAIIVGSLIYACVNGFAGPINWFLSLQVWKLHSRLSYAMYLFHYMLMSSVNFTAIAPVFFSVGSVTFKFLAHYSLSLIVSYFMVLLIDAPFSTLFKLMIGGGAKTPMTKNETHITDRVKENEKQV